MAAVWLVCCLGISLAATPAPNKRVRILYADFSERMGLFFVAKDQRFFEEQGLDADLVQVNTGPVAVAAMAANEAEFYTVSATGSALGAISSGLDLVWVAGMINKLDGYFYVSPKVQKPEDLKGKTLGVQSIGGGIWMFVMMTLDHWGLSPERDKIQMRVIGDQSVLVQSLNAGLIDGSVWGYAYNCCLATQRRSAVGGFDGAQHSIPGNRAGGAAGIYCQLAGRSREDFARLHQGQQFCQGQKQSSGGGAEHS